jgi:hypothetical protein
MGPWGIAAIALIGATATDGGRKLLRSAAKNVIRAGFYVKEKSSGLVGEVKEQLADVVAEIKTEVAEAKEESENGKKTKSSSKAEKTSAKDA